tara:strand:- start:221 stop:352 length:132 start_codon:yes stop_codon:yes gene_type:complete
MPTPETPVTGSPEDQDIDPVVGNLAEAQRQKILDLTSLENTDT